MEKWWSRLIHKLFFCHTFWTWRPMFQCPECGKKYRCYWDGADVDGYGINFCHTCADKLEALTVLVQAAK
jgi:hypothetical protein